MYSFSADGRWTKRKPDHVQMQSCWKGVSAVLQNEARPEVAICINI